MENVIAVVKGFRPINGNAYLTVSVNDKTESFFLGDFMDQGGIEGLMPYKGKTVELEHAGSKTSKAGKEYQLWNIVEITL